jgi:hypothetical protein
MMRAGHSTDTLAEKALDNGVGDEPRPVPS